MSFHAYAVATLSESHGWMEFNSSPTSTLSNYSNYCSTKHLRLEGYLTDMHLQIRWFVGCWQGLGGGGQEGMLNTPGGLTVSESGPRCSGSRGFSSVICCSFIPAILDSNLQSPWQQAQNAHRHRQCGFRCYFVRPGFCWVLTLKNKKSTLAPTAAGLLWGYYGTWVSVGRNERGPFMCCNSTDSHCGNMLSHFTDWTLHWVEISQSEMWAWLKTVEIE